MLEIRVHGIGDHKELSALGVGTELQPNAVPGAQAYLPPPIPDHALVLVNWSRASRLRASLLWYLSLPFSLVNIAAQMSPPGRTAWRRTFPIAVWTAGLQ